MYQHICATCSLLESGCNDGAAFPFLFIALYLIIDASDSHAVEEWFLVTWLCKNLLIPALP